VDARRTLTASVQAFPGPRWSVPDAVAGFEFFDVDEDGRYLVFGHDPINIRPAGAPDVAKQIGSAITHAARIQADMALSPGF